MNCIRKLIFCLVLVLAAAGGTGLYSQAPAPPPPKAAPVRVVGKAEVYSFPKRNMSSASVHVYLLGTPEDIYKKKDVLTLSARYDVAGPKTVQPEKVTFLLAWYSPTPKPAAEHTLTLIADGKTLLSTEVSPTHPFGRGSSEYYNVPIDYGTFQKFANAGKAVLKLGTTSITLTAEMAQALKDLDATIER
jgi:hypothetical protein